jgi:drug/metabolite transporter (DMT)-like permease
VIGVLAGAATAVMWGASTVAASRSTRMVGSQQALAYVMASGLLVAAAIAVASGPPADPAPRSIAWALAAGAGSVFGLSFMYRALRVGKVGIVAPIAATEGGLAALLAVALGERLGAGVAIGLALMTAGVVVVTLRGERGDVHLGAVAYAVAASCGFALGLVASARAGEDLGPFWTITVTRMIGVLLVTLPLVVRGALPRPGAALPLLLVSGVAEVVGFAAYVVGAEDGVAVPAVLASQFAAVAAVASFVLFGERLTRRQVAGIAAILAGVAVVSALQP